MSRSTKGEKEDQKGEESSGLADMVKKIVSVGVGSAFMTEEAIKNALSDIPLPKDILSGLLQNARQAKEDLLDGLREEVRERLTKVDPNKLIDDLVERYDIEVQATFKFKRKKGDLTKTDE